MLRIRTVLTGVTGTPYYSTLYFTDEGTSTAAQAAVDSVGDLWRDFDNNMTSGISWSVEGFVQNIDPATGALTGAYSVTGVTGAGSSADQPLPWSSQLLVQLRTPGIAAGKLVRGRMFVPGLTESANSGGQVDGGIVNAYAGQAAAMIARAPEWLVWSRTGGVSFPVTQATVWNQWAVLRSRRD